MKDGISDTMSVPRGLWLALAGLMALQAVLGLVFADAYRDAAWIRLTWLGNDWGTLVMAVPMLVAASWLAGRGSLRGVLLGLGGCGYGLYNFSFYLFGAALNVFFALYVVLFVLSVVTLGATLARLDARAVAARFSSSTPVRAIGGYLVFVAVGLSAVWLGMWAAYAFAGRPTPVEPDAFQVVAALDLSLMVPALAAGGVLLWRRHPWGYLVSAIAGIQGTLYLTVLSVNSLLFIQRGLAKAPGELPIWGTLGAGTAAASAALLLGARGRRPSTDS